MAGRAPDRAEEDRRVPTPPAYGLAARPLFRLDPDIAFLNHGSFGAVPIAVSEAQDALRREMERQPVQFMTRRNSGPRLRRAAAELAAFLGAEADDLVLVENATAGVNTVLRSLALRPGDAILVTDHAYGAVRNAVEHVCRRSGARLVEARLPFPPSGPEAVVEAVARALTPQVRLAVLDLVTSPTALVLPVAALAAVCREAGARVLVDAAHGPGMLDLDVPGLGADWVAGNAHKWLFAPRGAAFLWARKEAQRGLHPLVISHGYRQGLATEFDWVGTRDLTAWLSIPAAIAFYDAMGGGRIRAYNHALALEAAALIAGRWGTTVGGPPAMTGSMATIRLPGEWPATRKAAERIHDRLWEQHRIEVPVIPFAGALWVRISAQIYNSIEDYARLADAVPAPGGP
jgi:isopenicillin-N epimerase